MLGTGARIGQGLAVRWSDADFGSKRVKGSATMKTETGVGTYRKPLAEARLVEFSTVTVGGLRRRQSGTNGGHNNAAFTTRTERGTR